MNTTVIGYLIVAGGLSLISMKFSIYNQMISNTVDESNRRAPIGFALTGIAWIFMIAAIVNMIHPASHVVQPVYYVTMM